MVVWYDHKNLQSCCPARALDQNGAQAATYARGVRAQDDEPHVAVPLGLRAVRCTARHQVAQHLAYEPVSPPPSRATITCTRWGECGAHDSTHTRLPTCAGRGLRMPALFGSGRLPTQPTHWLTRTQCSPRLTQSQTLWSQRLRAQPKEPLGALGWGHSTSNWQWPIYTVSPSRLSLMLRVLVFGCSRVSAWGVWHSGGDCHEPVHAEAGRRVLQVP